MNVVRGSAWQPVMKVQSPTQRLKALS